MRAEEDPAPHLARTYKAVRSMTQKICESLVTEDFVIQSCIDVSPPKWHLAHTTWFFENFILVPHARGYKRFNEAFYYLFNSYYHNLGEPFPRGKRGLLSRPDVKTIYKYRQYVDEHVLKFLERLNQKKLLDLTPLFILGHQHEQQHQELLLMDIKHNFFMDPEYPVFQEKKFPVTRSNKLEFIDVTGGKISIGHQGNAFCFDNELPRHTQILQPFKIANRLVTNEEYYEFIDAGHYLKPKFWLADGWDTVVRKKWTAPLYWVKVDGNWNIFTLSGLKKLNPHEPVSHVSFYEADAFARWKKCRLPTESEWEYFVNSKKLNVQGNLLESHFYHPVAANKKINQPQQFFGDLWEWTSSAYLPYPGYHPLKGNLSEYNGKFMSNQMVLRGGSCATPQNHIRHTYRNFFQPDKRWQFSGIRLAANL